MYVTNADPLPLMVFRFGRSVAKFENSVSAENIDMASSRYPKLLGFLDHPKVNFLTLASEWFADNVLFSLQRFGFKKNKIMVYCEKLLIFRFSKEIPCLEKYSSSRISR